METGLAGDVRGSGEPAAGTTTTGRRPGAEQRLGDRRHGEPAGGTDPLGRPERVDPPVHGEGVDPLGRPERVDPLAHRERVVRRLLDLGLSPATLVVLLPDFRPLVDRLARRC
jgi:hypothetical protein